MTADAGWILPLVGGNRTRVAFERTPTPEQWEHFKQYVALLDDVFGRVDDQPPSKVERGANADS